MCQAPDATTTTPPPPPPPPPPTGKGKRAEFCAGTGAACGERGEATQAGRRAGGRAEGLRGGSGGGCAALVLRCFRIRLAELFSVHLPRHGLLYAPTPSLPIHPFIHTSTIPPIFIHSTTTTSVAFFVPIFRPFASSRPWWWVPPFLPHHRCS